VRTVTDAYGHLRTPAALSWCAGEGLRRSDGGYPVDSGDESAAEGAGLYAQKHRQDHKRPSGVELGTGLMPNGVSSPGTLPNRLN
jgi:hypothetical protein